MKIAVHFVFIFLFPLLCAAEPLTLSDAYTKAVEQSEKYKRSLRDIRIAQARYEEVLSALYPNLSLNAQQIIENPNGDLVTNDSGTSADHGFRAYASVQQLLFRGFRELILSDAANDELKAIELESKRVKELIYLDVSDVFHQIHVYENDIKLFKQEGQLLRTRIEELQKLLTLGRARESEIVAVRADLANLNGTIEARKGVLNASKELLSFLTGVPSGDLKLKLEPLQPALPLDNYLSRFKERYDLNANELRVEAKRKNYEAARREWWPTVTFQGNVYPYTTLEDDQEWDAAVQFSIPIFDGGAINARITQTEQAALKEELQAGESVRKAESDIRTAYAEAAAAKAVVAALRSQVSISAENTQSQKKDYELGVVTNLQVLTAIRAEQSVKRELVNAEARLRSTVVKLSVLAGGV